MPCLRQQPAQNNSPHPMPPHLLLQVCLAGPQLALLLVEAGQLAAELVCLHCQCLQLALKLHGVVHAALLQQQEGRGNYAP